MLTADQILLYWYLAWLALSSLVVVEIWLAFKLRDAIRDIRNGKK